MKTETETETPLPKIVYKYWWPMVQDKFYAFKLSTPSCWSEAVEYVEQTDLHYICVRSFSFLFKKDITLTNRLRDFVLEYAVLNPVFTAKTLTDKFVQGYNKIPDDPKEARQVIGDLNKMIRNFCQLMVREGLLDAYSLRFDKIARMKTTAVYYCDWAKQANHDKIFKEYEMYAKNAMSKKEIAEEEELLITDAEKEERTKQKMIPHYKGMHEAAKDVRVEITVTELVEQQAKRKKAEQLARLILSDKEQKIKARAKALECNYGYCDYISRWVCKHCKFMCCDNHKISHVRSNKVRGTICKMANYKDFKHIVPNKIIEISFDGEEEEAKE